MSQTMEVKHSQNCFQRPVKEKVPFALLAFFLVAFCWGMNPTALISWCMCAACGSAICEAFLHCSQHTSRAPVPFLWSRKQSYCHGVQGRMWYPISCCREQSAGGWPVVELKTCALCILDMMVPRALQKCLKIGRGSSVCIYWSSSWVHWGNAEVWGLFCCLAFKSRKVQCLGWY